MVLPSEEILDKIEVIVNTMNDYQVKDGAFYGLTFQDFISSRIDNIGAGDEVYHDTRIWYHFLATNAYVHGYYALSRGGRYASASIALDCARRAVKHLINERLGYGANEGKFLLEYLDIDGQPLDASNVSYVGVEGIPDGIGLLRAIAIGNSEFSDEDRTNLGLFHNATVASVSGLNGDSAFYPTMAYLYWKEVVEAGNPSPEDFLDPPE